MRLPVWRSAAPSPIRRTAHSLQGLPPESTFQIAAGQPACACGASFLPIALQGRFLAVPPRPHRLAFQRPQCQWGLSPSRQLPQAVRSSSGRSLRFRRSGVPDGIIRAVPCARGSRAAAGLPCPRRALCRVPPSGSTGNAPWSGAAPQCSLLMGSPSLPSAAWNCTEHCICRR